MWTDEKTQCGQKDSLLKNLFTLIIITIIILCIIYSETIVDMLFITCVYMYGLEDMYDFAVDAHKWQCFKQNEHCLWVKYMETI